MKRAYLILCFLTLACGGGNKPRPPYVPPAQPTPEPIEQPIPIVTPTPTLVQPCASEGDVTPAIYEAKAKGETHTGGGCIRSQLTVEGAMRIAGVYQVVEPILVKSGGSIVGDGWDTIILESTASRQWTVIAAHHSWLRNGDTDSNITLSDFKIAGANAEFWSTAQAVSLGNCVKCTVDNLWLDRTHSIGVQLGGSGQFGHYAKDSSITNCLFTHVASQAIALVNGENIKIDGNKVFRPGQAGGPNTASIDLEVNDVTDRLINVTVTNNLIDHRHSEINLSGNGIMVNSADSGKVGGVLVDNNVIIGGDLEPPRSYLSNGIMVFGRHMQGVTVTNNRITRTGQKGIYLYGSNLIVEDNTLDSVGGGGVPGFEAIITNTRIRNNSYKCDSGICDNRMLIEGDGNTVAGNSGWRL